jgi:hypothetical protein
MPLWVADLVIIVVLVGAAEVLFRVGLKSHVAEDEGVRAQVTTVQASSLGLLALILGFTMAMADARFDARRQVLAEEAGAVSTAYVLAEALPEPARSQSRELLRSYVAERRAFFAAKGDELARATKAAQAINAQLATIAAGVGREHPDWEVAGSFLEAVANVVRLEARRDLVLAARIPRTVNVLNLFVAVVAIGISGFAAGLSRKRSFLSLFVVPILIGLAYMLIADIDRSRAGFVSTGDWPMIRLQEVMLGRDATHDQFGHVRPVER